MSIFRVNKNNNYTVMSNYHLRDMNLTLKAKGLLSLMLSLPENWDYSINGLVAICKEEETSVKNALRELKEYSYLVIDKLSPAESGTGRFEYIYNIYEEPKIEKQEDKKQGLENLPLENLVIENHAINKYTNIINKDKEIKNNNIDIKKESIKEKIDLLFNQFWEAYPRKDAKQVAYKSFIKIKNVEKEIDNILSSIKEHKKLKQWQDKQYIPQPSTWLNQQRWKDDISALPKIENQFSNWKEWAKKGEEEEKEFLNNLYK